MYTNKRIDKLYYIHLVEYYTAKKKNNNEVVEHSKTWVNLTDIMLSERN